MIMEAKGTFTKIGDYIYRTDTYLKFGNSNELLGACVLCNPGSASLADNKEQKKLINYNGPGSYEVTGELAIDPAMRQLIAILEGIYGEDLNGTLRIFNLFTLRNSKMKDAIECINSGKADETMIYKDFEDFNKIQIEDIWVLRGWGVNEDKFLYDLKLKWDEFIEKMCEIKLGKCKEKPHYNHPFLFSADKNEAYVKFIINQYKSQIQTSKA